MATVGGIEQLGQTVGARRAVHRDERIGGSAGAARGDAKLGLPRRRQRLRRDLIDRGEGRQLIDEAGHEPLDPHAAALDLQQHAMLIVEHVAAERLLVRKPVDERSEPDALDRAADADADADAARGSASGRQAARAPLSPPPPRRRPTSSRSTWYALACASWMRGMCSERVTITWSASVLGEDATAVVADHGDRLESSSPRLGERRDHVRRVARGRQCEQDIAGGAVRDHLTGEDRLHPDVVRHRRDDARVLAEVERGPAPTVRARRAEVGDDVHRVGRRAAVAEREQLPAGAQPARQPVGGGRQRARIVSQCLDS